MDLVKHIFDSSIKQGMVFKVYKDGSLEADDRIVVLENNSNHLLVDSEKNGTSIINAISVGTGDIGLEIDFF